MGNISLHFSKKEFECPCCSKYIKNNSLVYLLEAIREHFRKPVYITSGTRCLKHNTEVGGAEDSKHLYGQAADIVVDGIDSEAVYTYANKINKFGGLGRYDSFTHIDVCVFPEGRRF